MPDPTDELADRRAHRARITENLNRECTEFAVDDVNHIVPGVGGPVIVVAGDHPAGILGTARNRGAGV